jgi:hypothetical protein
MSLSVLSDTRIPSTRSSFSMTSGLPYINCSSLFHAFYRFDSEKKTGVFISDTSNFVNSMMI